MLEKRILLDQRLKGTKCESCLEGRDLILGEFPKFPCVVCTMRPDRSKDKSHFVQDVRSEDVSNDINELIRKNSYLNY